MFIEFSVKNFKSIKDRKTFSMVSSNHVKELHDTNTFDTLISKSEKVKKEINILKSSVLYGANASGKSNLLEAISFMKNFVIQSAIGSQSNDDISVVGFKFDSACDNETTTFEIHFVHDKVRYRYGFDLDTKKIHNEWLFFSPLGKEAKLFIRENDNYDIGEYFKESNGLEKRTRPNALFLSVCAQFNVNIAKEIIQWFNNINVISGLHDFGYMGYTVDNIKNDDFKKYVMNFMKIADVGIEDIFLEKTELSNDKIPTEILNNIKIKLNNQDDINKIKATANRLFSIHKKYNNDDKSYELIPFDFDNESRGTIKLFAIAGPIIDTLLNGKILIVDELDSKLHPLLTRFILQYFNSTNNDKNSQLIFATHDTNILNNTIFRRDQVWFTEKNVYGVTDLYSLSDYKVRSNSIFNKEYIEGRYGAIPFIGNISELLDNNNE